jgi:hypothetical protein
LIDLDDVTYAKLISFCQGRDVNDEIYTLIKWAEEQMTEAPGVARTIPRYYDIEKYKRTSKADLRHTSQEDPEGQ